MKMVVLGQVVITYPERSINDSCNSRYVRLNNKTCQSVDTVKNQIVAAALIVAVSSQFCK